jgi:outer membrane protein assembly factor BamB
VGAMQTVMTGRWQGGAVRRAGLAPGLAAMVVALAAGLTACGGGPGSAAAPASGAGAHGASQKQALSAWQARQPQYDALATVTYGDELVVTADTGVYGYDRADGRLLWTVDPPGGSPGHAFCGSGQAAAGGKLPVGFGVQTDVEHHILNCTSVGLVDLRSGRMLWTRQIPAAAQLAANPLSTDGVLTEISGGTVMATWNSVGTAFSAATGRRLWMQGYSSEFRDLAVSHGRFYALFAAVAPLPGQAPVALDGISPASGDIASRLHLTGRMVDTSEPEDGAIVSTTPMTLVVSDESAQSDASYVVLDPSDRHVARVIAAGAQFPGPGRHVLDAAPLGGNADSHHYVKAVTGDGVLVAVSYPAAAEQAEDRLVAYDLSTGARRWSVAVPGVKVTAPVAVDGSAVIAAGITDAGAGVPTLVRVSLASGQVQSSTPRPTGQDAIQDYLGNFGFTWSDGRAYAVDWEQEPSVADIPGLFTLSVPA